MKYEVIDKKRDANGSLIMVCKVGDAVKEFYTTDYVNGQKLRAAIEDWARQGS